MLVLDGREAARPGLVAELCRRGVDWIQLRDRSLEARPLLGVAERLRREAPAARLLVNRRCDVALAAGADGVHLGFDAAPADVARSLLGAGARVGVSAHDPAEIDPEGGADYAHLAPIHAPLSKAASRPPLGERALSAAAARGIPVIAQGGIEAHNARAAVAAGAAGVAVTGAILQADDPARAAAALREALDGATTALREALDGATTALREALDG